VLERRAPWLSIVGIGEDGLAGLTAPARALVDDAEVLIGGERHLAMLPDDDRERHAWPTRSRRCSTTSNLVPARAFSFLRQAILSSEERRVGKAGVRKVRS